MTTRSLGAITVTTAGTPVQVSVADIQAKRIRFAQVSAQAGAIHVGIAGLVASTGVGLIQTLPAPSGAALPVLTIEGPGGEPLNLRDYWVDAATNGHKVIVSYEE